MIDHYVKFLRHKGYYVDVATCVSDAENQLKEKHFDMLILDIAIPVLPEEEKKYPATKTGHGYRTGFHFYHLWRKELERRSIKLLVFSHFIEYGPDIAEFFIERGVTPDCILSAFKYQKVVDLFKKVETMIDLESSS